MSELALEASNCDFDDITVGYDESSDPAYCLFHTPDLRKVSTNLPIYGCSLSFTDMEAVMKVPLIIDSFDEPYVLSKREDGALWQALRASSTIVHKGRLLTSND
jgi:hypothetical protein